MTGISGTGDNKNNAYDNVGGDPNKTAVTSGGTQTITGDKKTDIIAPSVILKDFTDWAQSLLDPANPQLPLPADGASLTGLSQISWFSGSSFVAFLEAFLSAMQMFMSLQSQEQKMEFKGMINTLVLGVVNAMVIQSSMQDDIDKEKMQAITSAVSAGVSGASFGAQLGAEFKTLGKDDVEIKNLQDQKTVANKDIADDEAIIASKRPTSGGAKALADHDVKVKAAEVDKKAKEHQLKVLDSQIHTVRRNYTQTVKAMVEQLSQMMTQAMTALNAGYGATKDTDKQQWEGLKALIQSWIEVNKQATDSSHQSFQSAGQEFDSMIQLLMKLSQWIAQWGGNKGS